MHVTWELPEVSRDPLRLGITLVELPRNRRITKMRNQNLINRRQDTFVLNELIGDIDLALNRCRAVAKPDCDDRILACFHGLVKAKADIHDLIQDGLKGNA